MNSECSICFEIVRSDELQKPTVTRCGHLFHDNCIHNCLPLEGYGKCPQCNQRIRASELIRVYVNEPENSARAKDELIQQMRKQLHELNEKAQLQYDLIGSLNRQIVLEKELSESRNVGYSSRPEMSANRQTSDSTSQRTRRIVAPARLNVQKREYVSTLKGSVPSFSLSSGRPLSQGFSFGSNCQTGLGSINLWGNSSETVSKPLFNFGDGENLGACGSSKTINRPTTLTGLNLYGSGANPTFGDFSQKVPSNDSSDGRTETQIPTESDAQNTNLFVPITASTTKPSFTFNSASSTKGHRRSSITSSRYFTSQRRADVATSPCLNVSTASSSQCREAEPSPSYDWPSPVLDDLRDISSIIDDIVPDEGMADPPEALSNVVDVKTEKEDSQSL